MQSSDIESEIEDEDNDYEDSENPMEEDLNEFAMEDEVANALGDADEENDKEDEASTNTNDRMQKLVNNKKKKRKIILEETSNKEEDNKVKTPTAPDENEEEHVDLMLANPENNKMHLAHIKCLNGQIHHPENSINENENVVASQLPLNYLKSKKPTLQEAKNKLEDLSRHNPHMKIDWKGSTVTEVC